MSEDCTEIILKHKQLVKDNLVEMIRLLKHRAEHHDDSKLGSVEKPIFDKYSQKLKQVEYGSEEYKSNLKQMQIALDHHYANNSHHPEHFANGIAGMNILDLMELVADWYVSAKANNGKIHESIEKNQERFHYSDDLKSILHNSATLLDMVNAIEWQVSS